LFCSCISYYSFSQTYKKRSPEEKAKYYTDEMAKDVSIDSMQYAKAYLINVMVSKQFDSLYASQPDAELKRKGSIAIYRQRDAALRKVLSNQQFLKFDDLQREKREKKMKEKLEKAKLDSVNAR
jgi:hypothetical protein